MGWTWNKEYLDVILVPLGLLIMVGYHLLLLHRHCRDEKERLKVLANLKKGVDEHDKKDPRTTTALAHDNFYRGLWVERMMQLDCENRSQALTVINNNISAAFTLSSISMTISALIGTWFGTTSMFPSTLIYGNTSQSVVAYKHIGLLIFFLVAFAAFLQSARCLVHSSFLLSMPNSDVSLDHVQKAVVSGTHCWSIGMRALYFATTLLLWVFGPIPMFVSSVLMVLVLNQLDWNTEELVPYPSLKKPGLFKNLGKEVAAAGNGIYEEMAAANAAICEVALTFSGGQQ